jgi:hypothetical protein
MAQYCVNISSFQATAEAVPGSRGAELDRIRNLIRVIFFLLFLMCVITDSGGHGRMNYKDTGTLYVGLSFLFCEYLGEFKKKNSKRPNRIFRDLWKLVHGKNLKSEISCPCPFEYFKKMYCSVTAYRFPPSTCFGTLLVD